MSIRNRIIELEQRTSPYQPRAYGEKSLIARLQGNVPESRAVSELAKLLNVHGSDAWQQFRTFLHDQPEPCETYQDMLALAREFFQQQPPASSGIGVTL